MAMDKELARNQAQQKYREASRWWEAFELAVHRYRCWALLYVARKQMLASLMHVKNHPNGSPSISRRHLQDQIDAAHDHMLIQVDNMWSASKCATSCELAGRIYYEEYEECESTKEIERA